MHSMHSMHCILSINYQSNTPVYDIDIIVDLITIAAFLPAVNTTTQPVNLSKTVSQVVFIIHELGASRDFPNFDVHL